ncbi:LamG domain-containing protein [Candidatus Poribacteria bacterium]|nr:LamG domain-containing protein [Candidatus Poribacteria bacterium]
MRTWVFVLAIVSLLMVPSLTEAQKYKDDKSLILYLPFDEGKGKRAKDASIYGNDGELDAPGWVKGKFGMALEFDGQGDVVHVPTAKSDELQLTKEGTLECWFMLKGQGNSVWPRLMSKESTTSHNGGYALRLNWAQGQQFELGMEGTAIADDKPEAAVKPNIWYHGAGTFKAGEHKVYLNGEVVKEKDLGVLPQEDRKNELRIGGSFAGPRNFEGIIDEVRIWNRVLPQNEIKENMKHGWDYFMGVSPAGRLTTTWGTIKTGFE